MPAVAFYHPVEGYWVATDGVTDEILANYPDGTIEVPLRPAPNYLWQNDEWVAGPPIPLPVPESISFAQMLIGLVAEGWITEADGTGWLAGTLPPPVEFLISTLPENQRFAARARAVRPSEVYRSDPLVNALGVAQSKTPEELDNFFRTYANI